MPPTPTVRKNLSPSLSLSACACACARCTDSLGAIVSDRTVKVFVGIFDLPPNGAQITVAGLVLVRQRPGTANGVIFITLEDETTTCNVIVWRKLYETYRRAVISGRMLRITGHVQREGAVCHVIAEIIEDISYMLDELLQPEASRATEQP